MFVWNGFFKKQTKNRNCGRYVTDEYKLTNNSNAKNEAITGNKSGTFTIFLKRNWFLRRSKSNCEKSWKSTALIRNCKFGIPPSTNIWATGQSNCSSLNRKPIRSRIETTATQQVPLKHSTATSQPENWCCRSQSAIESENPTNVVKGPSNTGSSTRINISWNTKTKTEKACGKLEKTSESIFISHASITVNEMER